MKEIQKEKVRRSAGIGKTTDSYLYVSRRLQELGGWYTEIHRSTGVSRGALRRLARGDVNTQRRTVEKVERWLRSFDLWQADNAVVTTTEESLVVQEIINDVMKGQK